MNQLFNNPAFYSAIAAFFSAIAAWTMVTIQRRNALDAARPELVLAEWSRRTRDNGLEVIHIGKLKNFGKGPALHATFFTPYKNPPRVGINTTRISIISPGEVRDIGWEVVPMWQQATDVGEGKKLHSFELGIACFDMREYRHSTVYYVTLASDINSPLFGEEELGEGIYGYRHATSKPFWRERVRGVALAKIEGLKQLWRNARKK